MKRNVFGGLLLAAMLLAPLGASAQVTIGSGDLPQATLDIIGDTATVHGEAFRLIDGNQADGKVLMCHENGIGTWEDLFIGTDGLITLTLAAGASGSFTVKPGFIYLVTFRPSVIKAVLSGDVSITPSAPLYIRDWSSIATGGQFLVANDASTRTFPIGIQLLIQNRTTADVTVDVQNDATGVLAIFGVPER